MLSASSRCRCVRRGGGSVPTARAATVALELMALDLHTEIDLSIDKSRLLSSVGGGSQDMAVRKIEAAGREAIMDAAERLFAERGIDAVSLRTINVEAGYSVAALHYHFATRDGLIRALLDRAQPPMLERRAQMVAGLGVLPAPPLEDTSMR